MPIFNQTLIIGKCVIPSNVVLEPIQAFVMLRMLHAKQYFTEPQLRVCDTKESCSKSQTFVMPNNTTIPNQERPTGKCYAKQHHIPPQT